MSWKIFKVFTSKKRKSRKEVQPKETYKTPAVESASPGPYEESALESVPSAPNVNVIAPSPIVSDLGVSSVLKRRRNGFTQQSNRSQEISFAGGRFEDHYVPLEVARSSSGRSKALRNSVDSGRESRGSIILPQGSDHDTGTYERQLLPLKSDPGLNVPTATQPPTITEGGLTTCDDGGHDFEAEFLRGSPALTIAQDYSNRRSVVESVFDDLNAKGIESATDSKSYFIPCTNLHRIISFDTVRLLLQECDPGLSENQIRDMAIKIAPPLEHNAKPFRRVFAILILVRKQSAIFSFLKKELDDSTLPFYADKEGRFPKNIFQDDNWKQRDIRSFCQTQWEVWPVFFSNQGKKIVHYECRRGEVLPFVQHEWVLSKKGGSGEVTCYELHAHQQTLTRYTTDGATRAVAVKKLYKPNSRAEFDKEHLMLDRLTQYVPTPHLAKLLATYEMPKDSAGSQSKDYFLMFELADSTLSELWTKDPEQLKMDYCEVAKWVASQSQGLATALSSIHNFPRDEDDLNDRTHGFHGDIKPDNILQYHNWEKVDHKLGVLQITDFGLSSFHHTYTADAIKIRHLTGDYRPPESEMLVLVSPSLDTWTLGCLCLDFLTWLVQGPDGLKAFKKARERPGLSFDAHTCFWEVNGEVNITTVSLSQAVIDWVIDLCQHPKSSQFVREFCELILNHMLVMEDRGHFHRGSNGRTEASQMTIPSERIQTRELAKEMKRFLEKDIDYYTPSEPSQELNLFADRHCIIIPKPKRQLRAEAMEHLNTISRNVAPPQPVTQDTLPYLRTPDKPRTMRFTEKLARLFKNSHDHSQVLPQSRVMSASSS